MHTPIIRRGSALVLPLLAAVSLLAACDRQDNRTVGQKTDQAVASAERKANEIGAEARQAGRDARQAMGDAADAVADKSRDAAITAEVKARLARDTQLSALAINVDTTSGRVVLRGTAPDTGSRSRASELARSVDGVVSVDNDLSVQRN